MTTKGMAISEGVEAHPEPLTERIARNRLSLADALRYGIQIAACLRDLHGSGLAHGAVSLQSILLGPAGAELRNSDGPTHLGDRHADVTAFGVLLEELLAAADGPEDLRAEVCRLATECQKEALDMRQVSVNLRILGLQARQAAATVRKPVTLPEAAPKQEPVLAAGPEMSHRSRTARAVRVRVHLSLHWRPLANLAAYALSGK